MPTSRSSIVGRCFGPHFVSAAFSTGGTLLAKPAKQTAPYSLPTLPPTPAKHSTNSRTAFVSFVCFVVKTIIRSIILLRRLTCLFACILFLDSVIIAAPATTEAIAAHDRAVFIHDQWIRDPFITLDDDGWYYLTGTTLESEPDSIIGITAWRSQDLVTWEKLRRLWSFDQTHWIDLAQPVKHHVGKLLVWAPELHHIGDRWVIVHTTNNGFANLLVSASDSLSAPFTEPMGPAFGKRHDPSLCVDDDDTPWLVWGVLSLRPLKPDFSDFAGPQIDLTPADRKMGHEGSYVIKIGSKYVWFGTAWSTDTMRHGTYNLYYATADSLTGPYSERRWVGRFLGHGTPFQDKAGRWWCTAFYNANSPALDPDTAATRDLSDSAYTINRPGTTIVPLDIQLIDGDVVIKTLDPAYASPGPEEVQMFHP